MGARLAGLAEAGAAAARTVGSAAAPAASLSGANRRRGALAWLLLAPWLAAALAGHLLALRQERLGGLPEARPAIAAALGERTAADNENPAPLFVSPSELAPFFRRSLAGFTLRPVEEAPCGLVARGRAVVLDLNPWPELERARDRVLARAANRGLLAARWSWQELPAPALGATLLRLEGAGPRAADLCARALAPPRPWAGEPAALALAEDQLLGDGWHRLEVGDDLVPRRWGSAAAATLRFDRPLPAGRWALQLVGHRGGGPRPVEEVCVTPPGGGSVCSAQAAGRSEMVVPFDLSRRVGRPRAVVRHPLWTPGRPGRGSGGRRLSVMLEAAWIEPLRPDPGE